MLPFDRCVTKSAAVVASLLVVAAATSCTPRSSTLDPEGADAGGEADAHTECREGHARECTCRDETSSVRICGADGKWGRCICDDDARDAGDVDPPSPDTDLSDAGPSDGSDTSRDTRQTDADAGDDPPPSESPHLVDVSLPAACDSGRDDVQILNPEMFDSPDAFDTALNDPDHRIFCLEPGDYRDLGGRWGLHLTRDGSDSERRYLVYHNPSVPDDMHPWHMDDPEAKSGEVRTLMPRTVVKGSHWTFDRLRFADGIKVAEGAGYNIFNRLMLYRRSLDDTDGAVSLKLDQSHHSTVQKTVIARSESGYDCGHGSGSIGIEIRATEGTTVVGNEIFDMYCEDLIQASQYNLDDPRITGLVIADNDLYLTDEYANQKPVENAIDLKAGPAEEGSSSLEGVDRDDWAVIENNRIWNWYGGGDTWTDRYGPTGPVTIYHVSSVSGVVFRDNVVFDTETTAHMVITNEAKSLENHSFIARGNLLYDTGGGFEPQAADDSTYAQNVFVEASSDGQPAFTWGNQDGPSKRNTIRHNVFIDSDVGVSRLGEDDNDVTENAFYNSTPFEGDDPGSIVREKADDAAHETRTIRVRHITDPRTVEIPHGQVTDQSPHSRWFD